MKEKAARVLVVDNGCLRHLLLGRLLQEGFQVRETENPSQAFDLVRQQWPHVVVSCSDIPKANGVEMLRQIHKLDVSLPVVIATPSPNFRDAIEAVKLGAYDYLETPTNNDGIVAAICGASAFINNHREQEFAPGQEDWRKESELARLMGPSEKVRHITAEVARVAPTDFSVVIVGETGSGKDLVAKAIHSQSNRVKQRFLSIDCGAIPESLIENELFGHERGAFTGADRVGIGKFEAASRGTLFLDEISNLPLGMQTRLLRVLEEKRIFRIGSTSEIHVDVRLLAATNQNLDALIRVNAFREDLFHRLREYIIEVPPLRERSEDILYLAERFRRSTNRELTKQVQGFSDSATALLLSYRWPGNVRELRNVVRGGVLLADDVIRPEHLRLPAGASPEGLHNEVQAEGTLPLKQILLQNTVQIERAVLLRALRRTGGNKAKAARMLGIDYKTIHTKVRQYGIRKDAIFHEAVKE